MALHLNIFLHALLAAPDAPFLQPSYNLLQPPKTPQPSCNHLQPSYNHLDLEPTATTYCHHRHYHNQHYDALQQLKVLQPSTTIHNLPQSEPQSLPVRPLALNHLQPQAPVTLFKQPSNRVSLLAPSPPSEYPSIITHFDCHSF